MKSILTLTTIILYTGTNAQNSPPKAGLSRETITDPINVGAQFPGGKKALQKYLQKNLRPEIASDNIVLRRLQKDSIQIVIVSFLVDTTGNISEVRVENPSQVHPNVGIEAVKVIQKGPKWIPATQNGKPVMYRQRQSIKFEVSQR